MITLSVNKFLGALTNLIAYTQVANTTEKGVVGEFVESFQDVNVENGDGKVIRSADLQSVSDLSGTSSILTQSKPTVKEQYVSVENYKVIHMTINKYLMRNAFVNETQLADFVGYLLSIMRTSKVAYLSEELIKELEAYTPTQASQTVTIHLFDPTNVNDPAQLRALRTYNANEIEKTAIELINKMGFPTDKYNDDKLKEIIDFSSMKFIVRGSTNADLLVNSLATLLNSNKITEAQKWGETYVVPDEQFTSLAGDVIAWLMHKKKIQFGYFYEVATEFFDASTLDSQNFLHFAYYLDTINSYPAVVIKYDLSLTPAPLT